MKARVGCIPCFVKQGLSAIRLSTSDETRQRQIMNEILRRLHGICLDASPALLSKVVYSTVREMTGVADPFAAAKQETNRQALALLPGLRERIARAQDPLHAAIKVALVGNVIDLGIGHRFDLEHDIQEALERPLTIDDYGPFLETLKGCRRLLYVCDNAGEIVFDRLLIERLIERCEVTASVKSGPIINDATMRDAEETSLTRVCRVIETGGDYIGVHWPACSREFVEAFQSADAILSKGQGNFETLNDRPEEIFFLLKVKCAEVAAELGTFEGASVFLRNRSGEHHRP